MLTNNTNPGVGLTMTAPRNQTHDVHKVNPGPGSYQIPGSTDVTDRERVQNEITSKRYGSPGSSAPTMHPSSSPSPSISSSGQKRQLEHDSPREQSHQNGMTSKRYHSASGDTHHSK